MNGLLQQLFYYCITNKSSDNWLLTTNTKNWELISSSDLRNYILWFEDMFGLTDRGNLQSPIYHSTKKTQINQIRRDGTSNHVVSDNGA